jgi:ATP-dependent RNA helicase DeaD
MQKFRQRKLNMLVATDVAARGLDVNDLTHIINYSLPDDAEIYTHRCGRTGRAGKTGISVSLVHLREKQNLHKIEKLTRKPFKALQVPTGNEICSRQLLNWVSKIESVPANHEVIDRFMPQIEAKLSKLNREELLRRVVMLEFNRFLDDYRHGEDIIDTVPEKEPGSFKINSDKHSGHEKRNYSRLFINLGKSDGFYAEQLISLVNTNTRGRKIPIGKIDLLKGFSFFEVEKRFAGDLIGALDNKKFNRKRVAVEIAQEKSISQKLPGRFQEPHGR